MHAPSTQSSDSKPHLPAAPFPSPTSVTHAIEDYPSELSLPPLPATPRPPALASAGSSPPPPRSSSSPSSAAPRPSTASAAAFFSLHPPLLQQLGAAPLLPRADLPPERAAGAPHAAAAHARPLVAQRSFLIPLVTSRHPPGRRAARGLAWLDRRLSSSQLHGQVSLSPRPEFTDAFFLSMPEMACQQAVRV
eukprot:CAMPEP_0205890862 /NCGR_PEP_ID=MMETSP1083-20121108/21762_1 /ASSEMBLY_ACC=CAM_ASM_000430 /TAXON_ID=97485 /ORGANISM="Prymnesium parvum, Strain Texoma1" /LENGTH=191 /DNA_ID=CAMNT_0053255127 /DNA_START=81 /DNA_END=657 /DNA_ORIENTATION=-